MVRQSQTSQSTPPDISSAHLEPHIGTVVLLTIFPMLYLTPVTLLLLPICTSQPLCLCHLGSLAQPCCTKMVVKQRLLSAVCPRKLPVGVTVSTLTVFFFHKGVTTEGQIKEEGEIMVSFILMKQKWSNCSSIFQMCNSRTVAANNS